MFCVAPARKKAMSARAESLAAHSGELTLAFVHRRNVMRGAQSRRWSPCAIKRSIMSVTQSRRTVLAGAAGLVAASSLAAPVFAQGAAGSDEVKAIPELAPHWKKLDLAKIVRKRAAFISVSQNNSLYRDWGAQAAEKHWERGSLPATVKAAQAARKADNFVSFSWIGY
jgi:hypothetical protein